MSEEWLVPPVSATNGDGHGDAGGGGFDGGGWDGDHMDGDHMDGNMLAGPLREVFAVDLTAATLRCGTCGLTGPVARMRVYPHAPGLVARCPACLVVLLRLVRTPGDAWLDLRGATFVRIPMPVDVARL